MGNLSLEVITAEGTVFSGSADLVTLPGVEGQLTILPLHVPLITSLGIGEIRVVENGTEIFFAISGGFVEVSDNVLTILADTAERDEEIDLERSQEAERRAQDRLGSATADIDLERALRSLTRARIRVKAAQRRKSPRRTPNSDTAPLSQ